MSPNSKWRINKYSAQLNAVDFSAVVDARRPSLGLTNCRWYDSQFPNCGVLRIFIPGMISSAGSNDVGDLYARGNDLIATYRQTDQERVRPQVYWRFISQPENVRGIQLIVSMQTDLLDSQPAISTASQLPRGKVLCLERSFRDWSEVSPIGPAPVEKDATAVLLRPDDDGYSYLEMAYPSDVVRMHASQSNSDVGETLTEIGFRLLDERLEKGVIRRARVCGAFLPRRGDDELAMRIYRDFVDSPPPLTT